MRTRHSIKPALAAALLILFGSVWSAFPLAGKAMDSDGLVIINQPVNIVDQPDKDSSSQSQGRPADKERAGR